MVKVPEPHRNSKFYQEFFEMPLKDSETTHILGVGNCFFGIEQGDSRGARVDHYDFGIAGFNANEVRAKLTKLNLKFDGSHSKESFRFFDPDGFQVQVNAADYVGHVA